MENVDLVVALAEITQSNRRVMRVMRGDTKMWPSTDDVLVWVDAEHITSTIATSKREAGSSLAGTLLPNMGCAMVSMVVTMGGVDITEDAYDSSDGSISIEEVTGDIVITAIASPVIVFEDSTVKSLCVSNWGGNYLAGEITEWEAAQVTNIGDVFKSNTQITSFNELQLFTGLQTVSGGIFQGCTALQSIMFPNITLVSGVFTNLFRECRALIKADLSPIKADSYQIYYTFGTSSTTNALTEAILPSGTYVDAASGNTGRYTFRNCRNLTTIRIDGVADFSNLSSVPDMFYKCVSLTTIIGTITGINFNVNISDCPLTRASALVFLNGLAQVSVERKITFSYSTYNLLTDADIAIATAKNWQVETIIEWEDNNLRDYILAQFPNNVGLTYSGSITNLELATITDLGGKFRELEYFDENNTKPFTSFNELRFFTGLTSLRIEGTSASNSHGEFSGCTNLTSVKIPPIVLQYFRMDGAFRNTSIAELDLRPLGNTRVVIQSVVTYNTAITKVYLPKFVSLTAFYAVTWAFRGCASLTTLDASEGSDWSAIGRYSDFVRDCTSLTTIVGTITGIGANVTTASYAPNFSACPLTHDSAMIIINGLATVAEQKTITFKASTYATLTAEEIAIATNKGWQVASA